MNGVREGGRGVGGRERGGGVGGVCVMKWEGWIIKWGTLGF